MADAEKPQLAPVPPLPRRLTDIRPVTYLGTAAWLVAFVVVLADGGVGGRWFWITLCGIVLGAIGLGVSEWQRAAARRGSRGAQSGFGDPAPGAR